MELCGLSKTRPISGSVCPAFHRQSRSLSRRTFRIAPFQQKRYANSDENESPNRNGVQVDHAHSCQQKSDASDQKKWGSDSAVKRAISKPVGEAADGHRETAS